MISTPFYNSCPSRSSILRLQHQFTRKICLLELLYFRGSRGAVMLHITADFIQVGSCLFTITQWFVIRHYYTHYKNPESQSKYKLCKIQHNFHRLAKIQRRHYLFFCPKYCKTHNLYCKKLFLF